MVNDQKTFSIDLNLVSMKHWLRSYNKLSTHSNQNWYTFITTSYTILHKILSPCLNYDDKHEFQSYLSIIKKPTIDFIFIKNKKQKKHGSYSVEHLFTVNIVIEKLVGNSSILR